jgi:ComF family protein
MIHLLKYRGQFARAEWCAAEMSIVLAELGWEFDVVIPVPLSAKRRRQRGFNQSAEIARRLCGVSGCPVLVMAGIRRVRDTAPQVRLSQDERGSNVAGAFEPVESLAGLRVLLVDDVVTTGSTLQECAAACQAGGAVSVQGLALARDV